MFDGAVAGINTFNTSLVGLATALLSTAVVIAAVLIATQVGGQGIQKPVRQIAMTLGICALLLKGYQTIVTGTIGMF